MLGILVCIHQGTGRVSSRTDLNSDGMGLPILGSLGSVLIVGSTVFKLDLL